MKRNKTLEEEIILASAVELKIRNNMFSNSIQKFLPVSFINECPTSTDGQTQILPLQPYLNFVDPSDNLQQHCNPMVKRLTQQGPYIINQEVNFQAIFFMLRMVRINEL